MADAIDLEMESVSANMKAFEEEKLLEKSNELHAMKLALKEKEQKVNKLRGAKLISDIAVDTLSEVTLEKPSVTKAKAKTGKITLSPVKAEPKSSEIKIHSSSLKPSTKSDDAIDFSTLRNDKKLRKCRKN